MRSKLVQHVVSAVLATIVVGTMLAQPVSANQPCPAGWDWWMCGPYNAMTYHNGPQLVTESFGRKSTIDAYAWALNQGYVMENAYRDSRGLTTFWTGTVPAWINRMTTSPYWSGGANVAAWAGPPVVVAQCAMDPCCLNPRMCEEVWQ